MTLKLAYNSLNSEQLQILENKTINGKFKPKALVKVLRELVTYDRANDAKRQALKKVVTWMGVLLIFGLIVAAIVAFGVENLPVGGAIAAGALVSGFIWWLCSRRVKRLTETDLANEMRRVLFPFALTMQEEAKSGTKMSINLDANTPTAEKFLVSDVPKTGHYGRTTRTYKQPWLSAGVTLVDNTRLVIECEKTVYDIKIVKRSASGKTKYKSKTKSRDDIVIKALIPKQQYMLVNRKAASDISVEEREDVFAVYGKYKFKTEGVKTVQIQTVFDLVHRMYSYVTPVSEGA